MGRVGGVGRWGDGNPPLTPPRRGIWGDREIFIKGNYPDMILRQTSRSRRG
ncbi:MAG: hypothetical protein F6K50_18630 [Moorea sp. SIO3I7]|uniref:hypothetical protein n=1 Tax=Moorena sp. SIO3I8 TaxID=2607833 RepID=UPI0013BEFEFF|nr:hypothetical protein [Moorena sp. SIO3I8]NEN97466.1 hypothetical protein [Moorena sp. SIO3I7]NEO07861.1 hypothetical protein [Moorena sp. SIO3I8]